MRTLKEFAKGMSLYSLSQSYVLVFDTYSPEVTKRAPKFPEARGYYEAAEQYADWCVFDYHTDDCGRTCIIIAKRHECGWTDTIEFGNFIAFLNENGKIHHFTDSNGTRRSYPYYKDHWNGTWESAVDAFSIEGFKSLMEKGEGMIGNYLATR